jgi:hypothetical protein
MKKALIAGLAVGALALAGCGPAANSGEAAKKADPLTMLRTDAKASLQEVATKTSAAKSAHITMTGTMAGQAMTATGDIAFAPLKGDLVMKALGMQINARLIGTVEYVQMPSAGGKWFKIDLADLAKASGANVPQIENQMRTMDPSTQVKALLGKGALKIAGEEVIDGVKTVHYVSDLTPAQYLEAYGDPAKTAELRKGLQLVDSQKVKTELWIDESYQVRRTHVSSGSVLDTTVNYSDYGKPVDVVAPSAADTTDMSKMLSGLGKPAA